MISDKETTCETAVFAMGVVGWDNASSFSSVLSSVRIDPCEATYRCINRDIFSMDRTLRVRWAGAYLLIAINVPYRR
jgi:hypothetical protein